VVKQIKILLQNFPKKHLLTIVLGATLLTGLSLLSNTNLQERKVVQDLSSSINMEDLIGSDAFEQLREGDIISVITKKNDSLYTILKKMKVEDQNILKLINSKNSKLLSKIQVGNRFEISLNEMKVIINLKFIKDYKSGVQVTLEDDSYIIEAYELPLEKVNIYKKVLIEDSMYSAGLKAGIPDSVIMDIAYIYGWDIDFIHDIRPGDSYSLIYEEVLVEGQKEIDGNVLIAEFFNQGKIYTAVRYDLEPGRSEYFSPEGNNVKKAFLRSPVKFSYISSKYNLKRKHPILHTIRSHNGVDYAAKRGSPIRTTGDGTVSFAGVKNGCGNEIEIKHSEDYSTRYCHLERFSSRAKSSRKVKQGQTIGYVGSSGLATGPHLHYEFHVNGKHTDPLKVKFPDALPINKNNKEDYTKHANRLIASLKNYQGLTESLVLND
jgi:murein DD-endopeptidase MepM/ murein hydrolase activator NlpD